MKILRLLERGRGQNWQGLSKTCGIGRRTVFRDLEVLRKAGVPIKFDNLAGRYSIPSGDFGPPSDLTAEEVFSVWAVANSVGYHPHIPFYGDLHTAIAKVQRELPATVRRKFVRMSKCVVFLPLKLVNLAAKAASFRTILDAIEHRRALQMTYVSASTLQLTSTKFRPYWLLFSEHSWYAIGHSSIHNEVRTFNLARIEFVRVTSERFSIPKNLSWESLIGNAWNMIPGFGSDHRVVLKFGPLVAQNVAQVKWHKTQRVRLTPDGSLIFRATVSGFSEISWWILRYGEHVEVLHPQKLRTLIATRLKQAAAMYA